MGMVRVWGFPPDVPFHDQFSVRRSLMSRGSQSVVHDWRVGRVSNFKIAPLIRNSGSDTNRRCCGLQMPPSLLALLESEKQGC